LKPINAVDGGLGRQEILERKLFEGTPILVAILDANGTDD
jgi:hypothetical protein